MVVWPWGLNSQAPSVSFKLAFLGVCNRKKKKILKAVYYTVVVHNFDLQEKAS